MIAALMFALNYVTSWGYPWFIYPVFAVLWWPLGVYFGQNRKFKAFSVVGGLYISGFIYLVNIVNSPNFPWFIFPVFAVLWWPLAMLAGSKPRLFSLLGAAWVSAFFVITNYIVSPNVLWFIFPVFAVLWWPLSVFLARKTRLFSIVASLYIIGFLALVNYLFSPAFPWIIFPAFAALWWPISVILCGAKKYKLYSVVSFLYILFFLALVNYIVSPGYIWFYYVAFPLIWWPLSMFLARKPKIYSVVMSLLAASYLALINYMNSPQVLWYPYTLFAFIWWPLAMLLGKHAKTLWFAVLGALSIIGYYVLLYYRLTPGAHPWYLYIVLPALWWPVSRAFGKKALELPFQIGSMLIFTAYYVALNLILTPQYFWSINLIYPILWAFMGIYFGHNKKFFAFSVCAAVITIAYFSILNYMTAPHVIWAVYPSFAILWWPLAMYFYRVKKDKPKEAEKEIL